MGLQQINQSKEYNLKSHSHCVLSIVHNDGKEKGSQVYVQPEIYFLSDSVDCPAQRGVATTSVASKKQVEDAKAVKEAEAAALADKEAVADVPEAPELLVKDRPEGSNTAADWEDDGYVEKQTLQSLVDRLNDKGDKEVTRVVKVSQILMISSEISPSSTTDAWHPHILPWSFPSRQEKRY